MGIAKPLPDEFFFAFLVYIRESNAHVISVSAGKDGRMDIDHLESLLKQYTQNDGSGSPPAKEERMAPGRRKNLVVIGSFSAASNVTGLVCDVDRITDLLHQYGALSFWDYASAAPSMKVDVGSKVTLTLLPLRTYNPCTIRLPIL